MKLFAVHWLKSLYIFQITVWSKSVLFIVYIEFNPWCKLFTRPTTSWSTMKIPYKNLIEESVVSQFIVKQ